MNFSQDTTSSLSELPISQEHYENLVTYELVRVGTNSGFGFDLKGDRPCVIGTVRKGSIADQAGLHEGDVVIAINNKKVTEYDHDQVVRLVGMSKNKLVIQVTKIKVSPKVYKAKKPKSSGYKATTIGIAPHFYPGSSRKKSRTRRKMNTTHSSQSTASSSGFGPDLTTNTKTTEDDDDESDLEFYYGTNSSSGRRRRHHHSLHHHKARPHSRKPKRAVRSVPQAVTNSEYVEFYEIEDLETDTEDTEDTEENLNDFKVPKSSRKTRNNNFVGYKQKIPISAKKIAYQQLKKSRKDLDPHSMPPPILTSTFHLNDKEKIVNNVSIESSELEYEPAYAPINPVKAKNPQFVIYSSSKAINSKTKQVNYEQYKQEAYSMSSSLNESAESRKPICVNIKTGQTDAKIANIKHFNSVNQMGSGTLRPTICQNLDPIQTYYSLSNLNAMPIKQLNSNDLYAILKPVIKPWVFNSKLSINGDLSFNLYYIGSIFIPYDTMSNAVKLNSIRNAIESFLLKTTDTEQSLISFNIMADRLKLINLCDSKSSLKNDNCVFYHKTEIAFCGKIKDNAQFFALVVLAQNSSKHDILMNNSTSCLIFRHLSGISIDLILNEISRLYRNQDYVFTSSSNLAVHGGQMPLMTNNNQNLSPVLHFSNHNYEILADEHQVNERLKDNEKSPYMILNKHTNDIYFNKENFLKEDMAHIPKDVSSLSNIEDNNMDSMNSSNGSKSIKVKKSKTQPKEVGNHPQGIKTIKENFANLFLSKKSHSNDSEVFKSIEIEANKFRKNEDGSNFKIKTRTSHAFQFLKSKPPLSVVQKIKPHQNSEDDNLDFFDANQVLNSFESNQLNNQDNNIQNRLSYPVNDKNSKTTFTAKRLLFNFISGNSNNSKENQNRPAQFQARRLSDYHRPTKSLNNNDAENLTKEKLNQTKISLTNSLIDVNEEIIKEKSNEIGRVAKWATGFENLLEDPMGLSIFTDFLKKEYSEENIDFWVRCEKFKKIVDVNEMRKEALDIWQTYLDTSSLCQINVDNKTRTSCKEEMQNPHCSMFELAQSQIFTLMKYDSYSRFLKSQMYKDCIVNEMENKPILGDNDQNKCTTNTKPSSISQTQANQSPNSNSSSTNNLSGEPIRKEKKKNILPWAKAKEKKNITNPRTPTPLSTGHSATLSKTFLQKTPLLNSLDSCSSQPNLNQIISPTNFLQPGSKIESKFCRILCNKDGSSTMIQPIHGQTVHQSLSKIYSKKNLPWYKSDLYFVGNYTPVDPNMSSQVLISREICMVERSLFVLSLIPVALNLCVKANMKKSINLVLQPILAHYQINICNCSIYLLKNSSSQILNLNDFCSSIDGLHVLVVHKQQLLSQNEIDKLTKISVEDLLPANANLNLQFDNLGILKQIKNNINYYNSTNTAIRPLASQSPVIRRHVPKKEDPNEKNFIDLLKRAQNYSLEDQRGRIDSTHLQIPEFLLTSSNLIKSQSMTQNLGKFSFELNTLNNYNDSVNEFEYQTNNSFDYNLIYQQNNLLGMQGINKSSVSLPVESNYTALPLKCQAIRNTIMTTTNRSRSPVMIVYDNDDYQNIDYASTDNRHDLSDKLNDTPMNYESISDTNSPVKINNQSSASFAQDNSRISYV